MQKQTPRLETITAKDLLTQHIDPLGFTIDSILPHGLFILAGSSKIGKSWLALDMCHTVATGDLLWDYPATQGDALYLALEDNNKRLQDRLNKISPVRDFNVGTDIHFVTKAQKIGDGLAEQINKFLDAHPQTKLIVIDTLQYIRNTGKFTGTYSGDYHDMDALREIIADRELTMLLITHNHKSDDADPLNRVVGSTGLIGAVDGVFVLEKSKRASSTAKLTIANRDTKGYQFKLKFDAADCRWQFIGNIEEKGGDEEDYLFIMLECILDETPSWSGTSTQLCAALAMLDPDYKISPVALSKALKQQRDFLQSQYKIVCDFTRNKSARIITLSRDVIVVEGKVIEEGVA